MTVALSLVPYSAAYVADAGADGIKHLRAGATQLGRCCSSPTSPGRSS